MAKHFNLTFPAPKFLVQLFSPANFETGKTASRGFHVGSSDCESTRFKKVTCQTARIRSEGQSDLSGERLLRFEFLKVPAFLMAVCLLILGVGCNQSEKPLKKGESKTFRVEVEKDPLPEYSMSEDQTAYLWDLEHAGNVLGKYGFKPLGDAIVNSKRQDFLSIVGDTKCTIISEDKAGRQSFQSSVLNVSRQRLVNDERKQLSVEEFADWWFEKRDWFSNDPAPKAGFYVKSLLPPQDSEPFWKVICIHRLWGNAVDGSPLEISVLMELKTDEIEKGRLGSGSWLVSCDIQQIDIAKSTKSLFTKTGARDTRIDSSIFYDNWKEAKKQINTGGVFACDYNRDGISDMFVTDLQVDSGRLYSGMKGGKFNDDTYFMSLDRARNSRIAMFVDIDNDGWEDLFCPDLAQFFRNKNGEKFVNYSGQSNIGLFLDDEIGLPRDKISGVFPADYDLDGDVDLYITRSVPPVGSWLESLQPQIAHNQLLRNDGNWMFTDVTPRTKTDGEGRSTFSAVWSDFNNDRYPDLYIINEFGNGSLLVNQNGKTFKKQKLTDDQNDFGSMGLSCGDYDNDGNIDIYVSNMYSKAGSRIMGNMVEGTYPPEIQDRLRSMVAGGELYKNNGDLTFEPLGKDYQVHAAGWAWGASMADLNNDGWPDLYVTAGFISRDRAKPDG